MSNTKSIDLELSSSQYLSITDASQTGLEPTNDFTIEMWIKPESLSLGYPVVKGYTDSTITYRIETGSTGYVGFYVTYSGGTYNISTATGVLSAGVWTHIAVVKRSTGTGMEIYINGVSSTTGGGTNNALTNSDPVLFGARKNPAQDFFDGLIDDVRVWSDVRTGQEIRENMLKELVGDEANLQGYWKLNNSLLDETSNNNDLTNNNSAVFSTTVPFVNDSTIAFDAVSDSDVAVSSSPETWSHTCTGDDRILIVSGMTGTGSDEVTGITYNGVSMTKITSIQGGNTRYISSWYLIAPATGSNTISASFSGSYFAGIATSYTGAKQSAQPDASATETASSVTLLSTDVTTVADNSWLILTSGAGANGIGGGTDTVLRVTGQGSASTYFGLMDSNGQKETAGVHAIEATHTGTTNFGQIAVSMAPVETASATENAPFFAMNF